MSEAEKRYFRDLDRQADKEREQSRVIQDQQEMKRLSQIIELQDRVKSLERELEQVKKERDVFKEENSFLCPIGDLDTINSLKIQLIYEMECNKGIAIDNVKKGLTAASALLKTRIESLSTQNATAWTADRAAAIRCVRSDLEKQINAINQLDAAAIARQEE